MLRSMFIRGGLTISTLYIVLTVGCAVRPLQTSPLPPGVMITQLNELKGTGPVAWHPSGVLLATGTDGLSLFDLSSGTIHVLKSEKPSALVWAPDGERLAIAWLQGKSTRLELRERDGTVIAETLLPGLPDQLLWSTESGLLSITAQLKLYSFGADLALQLHRWNGHNEPTTVRLHNNTIKPTTAKEWQQGHLAGSQASLSPAGDEMLYLRLHDPPAFSGKYRLHLRHLDSGAEKEITSLPFTTRSAHFIDDDRVLVDIDSTKLTEISLWSNTSTKEQPYSGEPIALSPGGRYWLIGEELLDDGDPFIHLPGLDQALFSPSGNRLLLQSDGNWHIMSGLIDASKPAIDAADLKKLRQLRNWRSRGLISPEEFRQQQQRMMQP